MKLSSLGRTMAAAMCAFFTAASAATVNVASFGDGSPSLANAQAAVNAAAAGDTVVFPLNGTATWTGSLVVGKALTLNGNGTTLTAGATLTNGFITVTGFSSTALMRITGFTFNSVNLNGRGMLIQSVTLANLRVDNNTFHHGGVQVEVGGSFGVFDHNSFYNGTSSVYYTAGTRAQADASWASMAAGTAEALFFEDNQFIYDTNWQGPNEHNACFDTFNGGKIVVRYNTFTATAVPASWTGPFIAFLAHGSAAGGAGNGYWQADPAARRGQSVIEIYNNTVTAKRTDFPIYTRGSANLIHNNSFTTGTNFSNTPGINVYEEEQYEPQWSPLRTSWPAEDQVHNTFVWANTFTQNGGVPNPNYFTVNPSSTAFIQQDRDYFLHAPQATGGREVFTGANGATNTFPTDGTTYANQGTMVFVPTGPNAYFGYSPYRYPHPLAVTPQASTAATVKVFVP